MLQGTGSDVGKSVLVSALCRIFLQDGLRVAPFKAQNMALNSFVTDDGGEIGRAQATQAMACRIRPTVDMNPILIKPTRNTSAQIIFEGKPLRNMSVYEYKAAKAKIFKRVAQALSRLRRKYEVVVIEGAGSPAEINLRDQDLVNMRIAKYASSRVILVGDIDRGGVFASLIGTLQLLTSEERNLIKGFIINKFRGDKRLLRPGITFLEKYTGIKVLGVIPYFKNIKIPEEDSLCREGRQEGYISNRKIKIAVIYLPHISNFTDFDALEQEPDVSLSYIEGDRDLSAFDAVVIPGTKNTIGDLEYLKRSGLNQRITSFFDSSGKANLIGICGGYQMLGEKIYDPKSVESAKAQIEGLGILSLTSQLLREKVLRQVKARDLSSGIETSGYEIHHGKTISAGPMRPKFKICGSRKKKMTVFDGARTEDNRCWGTYIHGVFDNDSFRRHFVNSLRQNKGLGIRNSGSAYDVDAEIDKLASLVRKNMDIKSLYKILSIKRTPRR